MMSIVTRIFETVARFAPDKEPDPLIHSQGYLGKPRDRVDGPAKVTGAARFIAEHRIGNLAHAALVCSTISKGRIIRIDDSRAKASPGVIAVITHENAPRMKAKYEQIEARNGGLFRRGEAYAGETYAAILQRAGLEFLEVEEASALPLELRKYSMASYGAQFCEVRVHEDTGEVRVSRWLGSFDCGRILNPKTAVSQLRGAIVMGIGAALTEEIYFDERRGRIVNATLAEYHVPVHLDVPHIEIIYSDIPDERTPLGAHGVGEIGSTGAAAAVANAVYHATGKRIRSLPITLDKLM